MSRKVSQVVRNNIRCKSGMKILIYGSGEVISSLNKRLFTLRRLRNHVSNSSLIKMVDGLFMSKIKFGLQLIATVRLCESDPCNKDIESIQKVQNKLLRMITNVGLRY